MLTQTCQKNKDISVVLIFLHISNGLIISDQVGENVDAIKVTKIELNNSSKSFLMLPQKDNEYKTSVDKDDFETKLIQKHRAKKSSVDSEISSDDITNDNLPIIKNSRDIQARPQYNVAYKTLNDDSDVEAKELQETKNKNVFKPINQIMSISDNSTIKPNIKNNQIQLQYSNKYETLNKNDYMDDYRPLMPQVNNISYKNVQNNKVNLFLCL